jgi:hypothetical protein
VALAFKNGRTKNDARLRLRAFLAIAGSQLAYGLVAAIGYPDVCPIKSCSPGVFSHGKAPEHGAVVGPQLAYCVGAEIDYPHAGSIEGKCDRGCAGGEAGCLVRLVPMQKAELVGILG